ncbi:HDL161Wp [Eremothecium sinecaudum]|uniref:HDL161Wp n=1 Tax=Eremothecium sinecaudum TaxID=45286 RepID=A0A109UZC6_9SACH|nr:HDL161Wp [Eremothecium sinecaudum]AMD20583.1 HDL161Wp [Eremothecium sinecaudum]
MTQKVLVIGSGFVSSPIVEELAGEENISVTVASRSIGNARELADKFNCNAIALDATNADALDAALADHDIVISLIPYVYHEGVVRSAIRQKKNVVTTSYISDALKALEPEIIEAGITVMNEIGLDPGIDHLYAVKTIDEVHRAGGKIKSFISYCGGLPAPDAKNNPFGYKLSWSCRGFLLSLLNSARYLKNGKIETIAAEDLMASSEPFKVTEELQFECYPNRDSTKFKELYQIPEAETFIRGTLKFPEFMPLAKGLLDLGMFDQKQNPIFASEAQWKDAFAQYVGAASSSKEDLEAAIDAKLQFKNQEERQHFIGACEWIGFFSDIPISPRGTALDVLSARLETLMQYKEGERDMICLQHVFGIEWADGSTETRKSTMVTYGEPNGYKTMATAVSYPCFIATKLVLDGTIKGPGLLAPYSPEINDPIMKELKERYGIFLEETTVDA